MKSSTPREWEDNCAELWKLDDMASKELLENNKEKDWTKAFQFTFAKSDIVDNNMCEAFNSSIVESRWQAPITFLNGIRVKVMTRIADKNKEAKKWKVLSLLTMKKS